MSIAFAVCYAVSVLCAFSLGCTLTRLRISRRVFSPWLHSITPGSADFWLRSRDWCAAFDAYLDADLFWSPVKGQGREFTDSPEVFAAIASSEVERLLRADKMERSK
jgi:hypothetical protein